MEIMIRNTMPEDYIPISKILDDEWRFHIYSEEKWLEMSEYYLLHCIDGANLSETLLIDGEPKGILVIREMGTDTIDVSEQCSKLDESIRNDPNYGYYLKDLDNLYDVYKGFVKESKIPEWAELRLLIISKDCKGLGLGRILMSEAEKRIKEHGMSGAFFYTDTDCNFGFYDHLGAERIGSKMIICAGEDLEVYGYRLTFDN